MARADGRAPVAGRGRGRRAALPGCGHARGASPARVVGGARQVTAFSVSDEGARVAFSATDDVSPAEIFVCRADGSGERQLTDLNREWKAEVSLARPERFRFERAGFMIDGWVDAPGRLTRRAGATRRSSTSMAAPPASTATASSTSSRSTPAPATPSCTSILAAAGATTRRSRGPWSGTGVAATTPTSWRGSTRRSAGSRSWILRGSVSWAGATGATSPAGSSATPIASGPRARSAPSTPCGACSGPATSATPSRKHHAEGRPPWDDLKWYLERSPLSYARDIRTPLLIMHSEDDLRCPMEQAEQLFVALKKLQPHRALRPVSRRGPRALALRPAAPPARSVPDPAGVVRRAPAPGRVLTGGSPGASQREAPRS